MRCEGVSSPGSSIPKLLFCRLFVITAILTHIQNSFLDSATCGPCPSRPIKGSEVGGESGSFLNKYSIPLARPTCLLTMTVNPPLLMERTLSRESIPDTVASRRRFGSFHGWMVAQCRSHIWVSLALQSLSLLVVWRFKYHQFTWMV